MTNFINTITNGTNFYHNYEVITNITNTNFITETNSITSWSDPALWFTGVGAGLTVLSAFLMWCSVQEMKKQRELEYKKLEMLDLKSFINENILPYMKEYKQGKLEESDSLDIKLIERVNNWLYLGLIQLQAFSLSTFYNEDIKTLVFPLYRLYGFTQHPAKYSHNIKLEVSLLLTKVCDNLYSILTNKETFDFSLQTIKEESDDIYKQLTPKEKEILEKHLYQFYKQLGLL